MKILQLDYNTKVMKAKHLVIFQVLFTLSFSCRLFMALFLDISNEEAYYRTILFHHNDDRHFESPLFQWIYYLFGQLDNQYWLRIPSVLIFSAVIVLIKKIGDKLYNPESSLYAVALFHFIPFMIINGTFSTPHALILFFFLLFWNITLTFFDKPSRLRAFYLGLVLMAGYLTNPVFPVVLIPFFMELHLRGMLKIFIRKQALHFFCAMSPLVLMWRFLDEYSLWSSLQDSMIKINIHTYMQSVILWFSPWFLLAISIFVLKMFFEHIHLRGDARTGTRSCMVWSLPLLMTLFLWKFQQNSMIFVMLGFIGMLFMFSYCICTVKKGLDAIFWKSITATCCLLSLFFVLGLQKFMIEGYRFPNDKALAKKMPITNSLKQVIRDEYEDTLGIQTFLNSWKKNEPKDLDFMFTTSWQLSSQLNAFASQPVLCFAEQQLRGYAFWNKSQSLIGKNGYLVIKKGEMDSILESIKPYFREIRHFTRIKIERNQEILTEFVVLRCISLTRPFPS